MLPYLANEGNAASCHGDAFHQDLRRARELYDVLAPKDLIVVTQDTTKSPGEGPDTVHAVLQLYCQLIATRCRVRKVMLHVMDHDTAYLLCQALKSPGDLESINIPWRQSTVGCSDATPLKGCICEMTVRTAANGRFPSIFTVTNLLESTFRNLPDVCGPPYFRFYAGTPITTKNGINIGSLAVFDSQLREGLDFAERSFLGHIASQIMLFLENNRNAVEGQRALRFTWGLKSFLTGNAPMRPVQAEAITINTDWSTPKVYNASRPSNKDQQNSSRSDSDNSSEHTSMGDSTPHSAVYARAAKLLQEIFGDLGEDGCVTFLSTLTHALTHSSPLSHKTGESDPNGRESDASPHGDYAEPPVTVLATSMAGSSLTPHKPPTPVKMAAPSLTELIRRFLAGDVFLFDDLTLQTLSDAANVSRHTQQLNPLQGSPAKSWFEALRLAFPSARKVLFMPLWGADSSQSFGAAFVTVTTNSYFISPSADLCFLHSFCCSVMAECSRLDTVSAERQKVDFVGTISHELRSPLHGMLAGVDFLRETPLSMYQQSLIDTIQGCSNTLLDTINHVLEFSNINTDQKNWQVANRRTDRLRPDVPAANVAYATPGGMPSLLRTTGVIHLDAIVEEVVGALVLSQEFSPAADWTDLNNDSQGWNRSQSGPHSAGNDEETSILLHIQKADWMVNAQPGAIRRVVLNLVGNALKYTSGGNVSIKLEQEHNRLGPELIETMHLTVSDTGKGISKRFLETKLFIPFAQEDTSSTGTGLGLSLVQRIISLLDGHIEITSEPDKGTIVHVAVPIKRPARAQMSATAARQMDYVTQSIPQSMTPLQLLQDLAGAYRVMMVPSRQHDHERVLRHYVGEWCGCQLVQKDAHVVIVDAEDLAHLARHSRKSIEDAAVLVISRGGRKYSSIAFQTPTRFPIEQLSKPIGPHKLAQGILAAVRHLENTDDAIGVGLSTRQLNRTSPDSKKVSRSGERIPSSAAISGPTLIAPQFQPSDHHWQHNATLDSVYSRDRVQRVSEVAEDTPHRQSGSHGTNPHVLIVDDNRINRDLLTGYLARKRKYTNVDSAKDGRQAVETCAASDISYDIIFMDISMPVMNGFEATRAIRKHENRTNGALIIALTGLASSRDQMEAFECGMDVYLTKPVSFRAVGDLLDNWESYQHVSQNAAEQTTDDLLPARMPVVNASAAAGALAGPLGLFHHVPRPSSEHYTRQFPSIS